MKIMSPHQKAFAAWTASFCALCQSHGGEPFKDGCSGVCFKIPTDLGILRASIHDSDYDSQKKRGFVQIYLRFETYDTGKVNDTLFARDFNGYSGKWNITESGGDLKGVRDEALRELEMRLNHLRLNLKTK